MDIGIYIKTQRQSRNWSMDELARRSGVSKTHISNTENRHSDPSLHILQLIAKAFDTAVGDMLVDAGYTFRQDSDHCPMCGFNPNGGA
jgi:transcriptional regulator with XRE-family HTH domain